MGTTLLNNSSFWQVLLGYPPGLAEFRDPRGLLQERVSLYMGVLFLITASFYGVFLLGPALGSPQRLLASMLLPGTLLHLCITLLLGGAWWWLRRGERCTAAAHFLEGSGTVLVCTGFTASLATLPAEAAPALVASLAAALTLTLRAALVPSSTLRTFGVGILAVAPQVPLALWVYASSTPIEGVEWQPIRWVRVPVWGLAAVTVTSITSRIIYGLQAQVRKAMQLGQYTLRRKLGEGGMGTVYQGTHIILRRPTAIKLLPPAKIGADSVARFEREVRQTSRLTHPNTVAIYDYGRTPDGIFYYAMEYLDGLSLQELVDLDGRKHPGRVVHILRQAAGSLAEAHGVGLIHRDIKPANIMLCERGGVPDVAKVLDFGLVKDISEPAETGLTHTGAIAGTPQYIAPEALLAPDSVDGRSDLYSLGAIGYFLLTGSPVFQGKTVMEVCALQLHAEPIAPSAHGADASDELEALILDCLAKSPKGRPTDAQTFIHRLDTCPDAQTWTEYDAHRWWQVRGRDLCANRQRDENVPTDQLELTIDIASR